MSLSFFGIAFIFYKTKNGMTRKIFLMLYFLLGSQTLIRGGNYICHGLFSEDFTTVLIAFPLTLASVISFLYLWFKYYKKEL